MKVPKGWDIVRFGEVTAIANGQVDPRVAPYKDYLHIGPENIESGTGKIGHLQRAGELGLISGKYEFGDDCLVYSKVRPNLNKVCAPGFAGLCSADAYPIRPDLGRCVRDYLLQFMLSHYFLRQAVAASMRTGMPKINRGELATLTLLLPPLAEQRRIAEILGAWDDAIEKVNALIQAKQKLKRALMQQLLTPTRRFPQFNTQKLKLRTLGEFFKHFKEANGAADRVPLSCSKVHGIIPQSEKFAKRVASADLSRYQVVRRGDLVFDPMLLWDASISFVETVEEGVLSPAYSTFHFNEISGDRTYFRELLKGHRMRHWYKVISRGTNKRRRKAMPEDFLQIPVPIPPLAEQQQIGGLLGTVNAECNALTRLAKHLGTQKRGLMQKLLTGQVRVKPRGELT